MSSQSIQFFMLAEEFKETVSKISLDLKLKLIAEEIGFGMIAFNPSVDNNTLFGLRSGTRIYITDDELVLVPSLKYNPVQMGWVVGGIPIQEDGTLFLSEISARSDWLDVNSSTWFENPKSIQLYRKFVSHFRKSLQHPAMISDARGGEPTPCRGVWFSKGTVEWFLRGNKLKQRGVENTVFAVPADM